MESFDRQLIYLNQLKDVSEVIEKLKSDKKTQKVDMPGISIYFKMRDKGNIGDFKLEVQGYSRRAR